MIARLFPIILAVLSRRSLVRPRGGGIPSGVRQSFEYGPRPPLSVFDPSGYLDPGAGEGDLRSA